MQDECALCCLELGLRRWFRVTRCQMRRTQFLSEKFESRSRVNQDQLKTARESGMAASAIAVPVVSASFFGRVKAELKKLFTHAPGWEASAAATLTYVAPMVEMAVTLAD